MMEILITILVICLVCGLFYFLLSRAPISGEIKTWGLYAIIVIAVIWLLVKVVPMIPGGAGVL